MPGEIVRLREAVRAFAAERLDEPLVPEVPYPAYTQFIGGRPAHVRPRRGTSYTFVTGGLGAAVAQARATAEDRDVVVLGGATGLFGAVDPAGLALERTRVSHAEGVTHLTFRVAAPANRVRPVTSGAADGA